MNYPNTLYIKWMAGPADEPESGFWLTCDFPVDGGVAYHKEQTMSDPDTNGLLDEIDDAIAEAQATAEECEELLEELEKTA